MIVIIHIANYIKDGANVDPSSRVPLTTPWLTAVVFIIIKGQFLTQRIESLVMEFLADQQKDIGVAEKGFLSTHTLYCHVSSGLCPSKLPLDFSYFSKTDQGRRKR